MIFDINNYKGKYVMHCKTEAESNEFCNHLHSIGRTWDGGGCYKSINKWHNEKANTCYNFNDGLYASKYYYIEQGYTILEWSDFTTEFTKADLKDGMVVELENGDRYLVINDRLICEYGWLSFKNYDNNLKRDNGYQINAVYTTNAYCLEEIFHEKALKLIWKRKEKPVEMTLDEVCKALGKEIKIVKES